MNHFCYDFSAATHIGAREENQDNFFADGQTDFKTGDEQYRFHSCCRDRMSAFAVFDGMGGMEGGRVASALAEQVFRSRYEKLLAAPEDALDWLDETVATAHDLIKARFGGRGGTTFTAGLLYQDKLIVYNVGDSPAYLLREGEATELTHKDNQAQRLRDMGCVPAPEDEFVLTRCLGVGLFHPAHSHVKVTTFRPGDRLVLCTDGVMNGRSEADLPAALEQGEPEELTLPRSEDPIGDNATLIVVERIR